MNPTWRSSRSRSSRAAGDDNGVLSPAMTRTMLQPVMNDYALGLQISDGGKGFGHGPWEPLYAESDKVLFILSRNLEMRPSDADSGHTVVGSSSRAYRRL